MKRMKEGDETIPGFESESDSKTNAAIVGKFRVGTKKVGEKPRKDKNDKKEEENLGKER